MKPNFRWIVWGILILVLIGTATLAFSKINKASGKLYMNTETTLLTQKAGNKCQVSEMTFCHQNARCPDGQVARGFNMNVVNEGEGKQHFGGLGLTCVDPNEIFNSTKVGMTGDQYSGTELRDACNVGTLLTGAVFFTDDRTIPIGLSKICRKWPTNEVFDDQRKFGVGAVPKETICDPGRFVTGLKYSYERTKDNSGVFHTKILNVALYCTELREYLLEPSEEEKTPTR